MRTPLPPGSGRRLRLCSRKKRFSIWTRRSSGSPCPMCRALTARCCSRRCCRTWIESPRRLPIWRRSDAWRAGRRASRMSSRRTTKRAPRPRFSSGARRPATCILKDEPLLELETDKVTVEIPSPATGELAEILKQPNEEVLPGQLLARIRIDAESGPGSEAAGAADGAPRREQTAGDGADAPRAGARRAGCAPACKHPVPPPRRRRTTGAGD